MSEEMSTFAYCYLASSSPLLGKGNHDSFQTLRRHETEISSFDRSRHECRKRFCHLPRQWRIVGNTSRGAVATPEGWAAAPDYVNGFYNGLRRQLIAAHPNRGHELLAALERDWDVHIITQNVDDLHERAGSTQVLHLHGELMKVTSSHDPENPAFITTLTPPHLEVAPGQCAADGSLLRPYIVWFGEAVPMIEVAADLVSQADVFVIVGTSLVVYPAAGLVHYARQDTPIYLIDPNEVNVPSSHRFTFIQQGASEGIAHLCSLLAAH